MLIIMAMFIPIILVTSFTLFNRIQAKKSIYDYIAKQGIQEDQLKYADFHMDFPRGGGYWLAVYVEGEDPNIYYKYSYRNQSKKVFLQAYSIPEKAIKQKMWGGNGLTETEMKKLKYPPLQ